MAYALGVVNGKFASNFGALTRSAYNFGCSMIFSIGDRYNRRLHKGDVSHAWKDIPTMHFDSFEEYAKHPIRWWKHVGVELTPVASNIRDFAHPPQCVYLLGGEDCGLGPVALNMCENTIVIPSKQCLNQSIAGSIIMFDRIIKGN